MSFRDHVITIPSFQTQNTIRDYISSAPFDTAPSDQWHVTVNVLTSPIDESLLNKQARYQAVPKTAQLWHDDATGRLSLVVVLESEDLAARHRDLTSKHGSKYETYVPHMTLVYGFPSLTRSNKAFVASLAGSMNRIGTSEAPLTFEGEYLIDSNGYAPNAEGQKYYAGF